MTRKLLIGLAVADLVFFGGWIAKESFARNNGAQVLLPVEGYDPRDLLSGHYVRFRLVADAEANALDPAAPAFCLEARDGFHHVSSVRDEGAPCSPFIARIDDGFGVDRFYVDERRAESVAVLPRTGDAHIVARISNDGLIHIEDLRVDGSSVGGD